MPRKKLLYTHHFPYHIRARSNNKEWFFISLEDCWGIFSTQLAEIEKEFDFRIHAFVLMNNHYHLLGSASENHNLGEVMCRFQTTVSRTIGQKAGRINHVFGGAYRASLIQTPIYYSNVLKYIYQNPLRANLCKEVQDYRFSSINLRTKLTFRIQKPANGIDELVPDRRADLLLWLNQSSDPQDVERVRKGLRKSIFKACDGKGKRAAQEIIL